MVVFTSLQDPQLLELIKSGAIGVLLTDTIYGVVASARSPEAVAKLYHLKSREQKPGTTIAASVEQLEELGLDPERLDNVRHLWPNSISVEMKLPEKLTYIHQGTGRSAFRVVADPVVRGLLEAVGPLMTSSANQPGEEPSRTIAEAQAYFGDQVDFYVDSGPVEDRPPSTMVQLTPEGKIVVLRQGKIHLDEKGNIL